MNLETIITAAGVDERDLIADAIEAAYALGFHEGRTHERDISKSQEFGAIRRSIQVIRHHEHFAHLYRELGLDNACSHEWAAAHAARKAIRAAIGSEKT